MMSRVMVNGDVVQFIPQFGARTIAVFTTIIPGSGHATIGGRKVCIKGDEKNIELTTPYISGAYTVAGMAKITIEKLDSDQLASDCSSQKALITQGKKTFKAKLEVLKPAQLPPPANTPEVITGSNKYSDGKGTFIPSQGWVSAG